MVQQSIDAQTVQAALKRLGQARIFFAHQSVGDNILEGLGRLQAEIAPDGPRIVDLREQPTVSDGADPFFAHARLGTNGDPLGKTTEFAAVLEQGLGRRVDIAFQKYCFVDIDTSTDVSALFSAYRDRLARLREEFPDVTFIHVTAPLMRVQSGPRAIIKRWIGRVPDYYEENIARGKFNDLMRREYAGREPLFDLAALESSRPGGQPEFVSFRNEKVYSLRPEYTNDGGHLTETAQRRVASELAVFLARTLDERSEARARSAAR